MEEEQEEQTQETQPENAQPTTILHMQLRINQEANERLEKLANYAALEGLILNDTRGNKTAWINYCLALGEEVLTQRAYQKKGF